MAFCGRLGFRRRRFLPSLRDGAGEFHSTAGDQALDVFTGYLSYEVVPVLLDDLVIAAEAGSRRNHHIIARE
jgi:hypothetical protein